MQLRQVEFASLLKISRPNLTQIERGNRFLPNHATKLYPELAMRMENPPKDLKSQGKPPKTHHRDIPLNSVKKRLQQLAAKIEVQTGRLIELMSKHLHAKKIVSNLGAPGFDGIDNLNKLQIHA